jgi:hypothetical protein
MIAFTNSSGTHATADASYLVNQFGVSERAVRIRCRGVIWISVSSIDDFVENG